MILAVRGGNRELRFGEAAARIPSPVNYVNGVNVSYENATGVAAIGAAIRFVSGIIASLPMRVYQGRKGDKRERPETPQARLLEQPELERSDFDWRWDVASSLEVCENAFLLIRESRGQAVELEYIPYYAVTADVNRNTGRKEFKVQTTRGQVTYSDSQILHIRGSTVGGGPFGVSRIHQHRDALGAIIAAQRFEGRYFGNDARPLTAYIFPQGVTRTQAQEWKADIEADYGGENYGKPFVGGGGVQIHTFPLSLEDAQYVEGKQLSVEEAGRIMDVHPILLGAAGQFKDALPDALQHFLQVQLPPRLERVERALKAEATVFGGTDLYPESEVDLLAFTDPFKRAEIQHKRIQTGTELVDEARADNGRGPLPPIPDDPALEPGKIPQITPVGGAVALPVGETTEE